MNILDLNETLLVKIFIFLNIPNLVKISEVCVFFNYLSKKIKPKGQESCLEDAFGRNNFYDVLPKLNINNYKYISSVWKNILFFIQISYKKQNILLEEVNPSNIVFSLDDVELIHLDKIHPSIKYLDCPLKIIESKPNISDNLIFLNMTEQLHIFDSIDFSSLSLKYLNLSFCDLLNVNLNFSKNLKVVNLLGAINLYSLNGLEYVENLNIDYCDNVQDISPLKMVKFLSMKYCENITFLPHLKNLEIVDMSYSGVTDVSNAINLKKLFVNGIETLKINLKKISRIEL